MRPFKANKVVSIAVVFFDRLSKVVEAVLFSKPLELSLLQVVINNSYTYIVQL